MASMKIIAFCMTFIFAELLLLGGAVGRYSNTAMEHFNEQLANIPSQDKDFVIPWGNGQWTLWHTTEDPIFYAVSVAIWSVGLGFSALTYLMSLVLDFAVLNVYYPMLLPINAIVSFYLVLQFISMIKVAGSGVEVSK